MVAPFTNPRAPATKGFKKHLVRLVASGIQSNFEFNPHVFVRMKTGSTIDYSLKTRVVAASDRWVHFDAPDREILFTRENVSFDGDRPFNDRVKQKWDYSFSLGFANRCGDDLPVDRFMINPNAFIDNTEPRLRASKTIVRTSKLITADSGGFQLGYGGLDFINPEFLAEFYTNNADEGVVLDIPTRGLVLRGSQGREILDATAHVHNMNAKYLVKNLPKDFRLGNVAHGITIQDYNHYRKIVESSDIDYKFMCIGGTSRYNYVEAQYRVLKLMHEGRKYDHYHILGLAAPPFVALLAWMMAEMKRNGDARLMTYDASTPIAATVNREYYSQLTHAYPLERIGYGKVDSGRVVPGGELDNPFRLYAMQDPIMNLVGGCMDYIHLWPSHTVRAFLVFANIHALSRYTCMMNDYAAELDKASYKDLLAEQLRGSKNKALVLTAVDFISYAVENGLNKAFEKFKFYLPIAAGTIQLKPFPLIGEEQEEPINGRAEELTKNVKNAINNFKRWHAGKWKDAPRFSKPVREHTSKTSKPI